MKCVLSEEIKNHDSALSEMYKRQFVYCDLITSEGKMKTMRVICVGCCLKVSRICEILNQYLTEGIFTCKELEKNPEVFYSRLPDKLKVLAFTVAKINADKTWNEIAFAHSRCRAESTNKVEYNAQPTEMTNVRKCNL